LAITEHVIWLGADIDITQGAAPAAEGDPAAY
jgi:hypothetical protein